MNEQHFQLIDYLREENRVLREQLGVIVSLSWLAKQQRSPADAGEANPEG